MENKIVAEFVEKVKGAKSVEELKTLAKDNGVELTEEEAKELFDSLSGALSDEDLNGVSGGLMIANDIAGRILSRAGIRARVNILRSVNDLTSNPNASEEADKQNQDVYRRSFNQLI